MQKTSIVQGGAGLRRCVPAVRALWISVLAAVFGLWQVPAAAQSFPNRPVRIIQPFTTSGASDALARIVAAGLAELWKVPVVVENRPGGSSMIAAGLVARAEPDGYTLLFSWDETFNAVPFRDKNAQFQPLNDLVPINLIARISMILLGNSISPFDSFPALVKYAKENPGKLSYGSYGVGTGFHLAMETLKARAGINVVNIPYKGALESLPALLANDIQLTTVGYITVRGMLEAGRMRPLAILSPDRIAQLPNVPTMRELGFGEVDATPWYGILAPIRTPGETVDQIGDALARVLSNAEKRKQIEARGLDVVNWGRKQYTEYLVQSAKVRGEQMRRFGADKAE